MDNILLSIKNVSSIKNKEELLNIAHEKLYQIKHVQMILGAY